MNLQTFRIAFKALLLNKMRSFLTVLGVIIGVAAVIAMVAIGEGAKAQIDSTIASMGTNLLIIQPGSSSQGGMRGGAGSQSTLTWDDLKAIQNEVPTVRYAAPQLRTNAQVISEDQNWATSIIGTSPEYFEIRSWNIAEGASFTPADVESANKVAVIGQTVSEMLFGPYEDPIGKTIRIRNVPFQVVGLLAKKGQSGMGQDNDDTLMIPHSAFRMKIQGGLREYIQGSVAVSVASSEAMTQTQEAISDLLRTRHRVQEDGEEDFSIRNLTEMANARQEGTRTMTMLLASIAAVSLLVGGIGIMNIMLVSVTERTREIGLRMAIGAKPRHILSQFLVEAITLSVVGGAFGVTIGILIASQLGLQFGWPVMIRPDIVVLSVVFSAVVGVGFGLYPAHKASQLNPIDALRFE